MKLNIRINKMFEERGNLKAMASVNFDNCFAVNGIRVIDSPKGLFVAMPSREAQDGTYRNICFPTTKEFREELNCAVLTAYEQKMKHKTGVQKNEQKNQRLDENTAISQKSSESTQQNGASQQDKLLAESAAATSQENTNIEQKQPEERISMSM